MQVGVFWLCDTDSWMERVAASEGLSLHQSAEGQMTISYFARRGVGRIQPLEPRSCAWGGGAIDSLVDVFEKAREANLDFAIMSFGRGIPLDSGRLHSLLLSMPLQNCVWSFRIGHICGVGMQNPPRLPFVDDHFIILNVRRAEERNYFSRKLINASHFGSAGYRHAQLASMIEYSIMKDEINNHFVEEASSNAYGQPAGLNPLPFHLCEATGFVTAYPELVRSLAPLLELNLAGRNIKSRQWFFISKRGYWFLRFDPGCRPLVRAIRRATHDIGKFDFKKRQTPEPK